MKRLPILLKCVYINARSPHVHARSANPIFPSLYFTWTKRRLLRVTSSLTSDIYNNNIENSLLTFDGGFVPGDRVSCAKYELSVRNRCLSRDAGRGDASLMGVSRTGGGSGRHDKVCNGCVAACYAALGLSTTSIRPRHARGARGGWTARSEKYLVEQLLG
jgi:hypothetical protein